MIPVVALATPWQPAVVLGTTLAAMVPTAAAGLAQHHRWRGRSRAHPNHSSTC